MIHEAARPPGSVAGCRESRADKRASRGLFFHKVSVKA